MKIFPAQLAALLDHRFFAPDPNSSHTGRHAVELHEGPLAGVTRKAGGRRFGPKNQRKTSLVARKTRVQGVFSLDSDPETVILAGS